MSDNYMSPEGKARQQIDKDLIQAGWIIQNKNQINLSAGKVKKENTEIKEPRLLVLEIIRIS